MKRIRLFSVLLVLLLVVGMLYGCKSASGDAKQYPKGDPDIANEKYNQLLVEWAFDKNYPNDIYADFPDFFGGAYIGDHGNLVILLTEQNEEIEDYFADLIGLDNVIFEMTDYSFATLISESDAAAAAVNDVNASYHGAISSVGISIPDNAINVYVNMTVVEKYDLNVKNVCSTLTSYPNIRVVEVKGYDEPA